MGGQQDQSEAVGNLLDAIFDGDAGHEFLGLRAVVIAK
jgi:hypothetical protein